MKPTDVLPFLADPRPGLLCLDMLTGRTGLRVPLVHRRLGPPSTESAELLASLPPSPTVDQLRVALGAADGIGLFAPALIEPGEAEEGSVSNQWSHGSIILLPPTAWEQQKAEFADWQFDGLDEAFDGLPYGPDDILCFSALNFSPDMWYTVLRGPMAGAVCWWTHDGASVMNEPWAADLKAWGARIIADVTEAFGGVIRPTPMSCIDGGEDELDLYPERYVPDLEA
ncbi:MAG TPA: hypothetical protein VEB22_10275 [Phycisphaerales bacterium]|nr:hypothetical protein [Phycisphaerales bacterium]